MRSLPAWLSMIAAGIGKAPSKRVPSAHGDGGCLIALRVDADMAQAYEPQGVKHLFHRSAITVL